MRVRVAVGALALPLLVLAGCSDGSSDHSERPRATRTPAVSAKHPGHLEFVEATAQQTSGTCTPEPEQGRVCVDKTAYHFDTGKVARLEVTGATAKMATGSTTWSIQLGFDSAGTRTVAETTTRLARTQGSLLLMIPETHRVVVAAVVNEAIMDGNVQISGQYTKAQVDKIVRQIAGTS